MAKEFKRVHSTPQQVQRKRAGKADILFDLKYHILPASLRQIDMSRPSWSSLLPLCFFILLSFAHLRLEQSQMYQVSIIIVASSIT